MGGGGGAGGHPGGSVQSSETPKFGRCHEPSHTGNSERWEVTHLWEMARRRAPFAHLGKHKTLVYKHHFRRLKQMVN